MAPAEKGHGHEGVTVTGLSIEEVHDVPRLEAMEELQARVWGFEQRLIVPAHVLYIAGTTGGIVLGAYLDGTLVGFALGFLGQADGRLYHSSHMAGVDPRYQGRNIGAALKWRQRARALAQGLDLMTWTFDPLEARNAHFNLHKLGAISRVYHEDLYGALTDRLNRDLPTDRLLVEWRLRVPAPHRSVPPDLAPVSILCCTDGMPALYLDEAQSGAPLSVSIPPDFQRLKREAPQAALAWRLAVREALGWALARGYRVCDFREGAYWLEAAS